MDRASLQDIHAVARRNNEEMGVTGMLLYMDGQFLQVLDGEKHSVDNLYQRIVADTRHDNLQILFRGIADGALFPTWSMGLKIVDIDKEPGFADTFTITRQALSYRIPEHSDEVLQTLVESFLMAEATAAA